MVNPELRRQVINVYKGMDLNAPQYLAVRLCAIRLFHTNNLEMQSFCSWGENIHWDISISGTGYTVHLQVRLISPMMSRSARELRGLNL
jgi:hypothetical protein